MRSRKDKPGRGASRTKRSQAMLSRVTLVFLSAGRAPLPSSPDLATPPKPVQDSGARVGSGPRHLGPKPQRSASCQTVPHKFRLCA